METELHEKYVSRLRARLARPSISMLDARDGIVDCFVSTYHMGLKQGLKGILGVDANPDKVAELAEGIFRRRLKAHGVEFDNPTAEGLEWVKEELDHELHFNELPAELQATHDQVCSLLLAKADGLLEHNGDRSVLKSGSGTMIAPPFIPPPPIPKASPPPAQRSTPNKPTSKRFTTVSDNLRAALETYLEETLQAVPNADVSELLSRLDRAKRLAQSIAEFSSS